MVSNSFMEAKGRKPFLDSMLPLGSFPLGEGISYHIYIYIYENKKKGQLQKSTVTISNNQMSN